MKKFFFLALAIALLTLASCGTPNDVIYIPGEIIQMPDYTTEPSEKEVWLPVGTVKDPIDYEVAEAAAKAAVEEYLSSNVEEGVVLITSSEVDKDIEVIPQDILANPVQGADFRVDVDLYSFDMTAEGVVVSWSCHNPMPMEP